MEYKLPTFEELESTLHKNSETLEDKVYASKGILTAQVVLLTYYQSGRELEAAESIAKHSLKHAHPLMIGACALAIDRTEQHLLQYLQSNNILPTY